MLNLYRSRVKAVRIVLGAVMALVSLSMLTYLIPSYGTDASASETTVAVVGKDTITASDLRTAIENTISGRRLPAEVIPTLVPQFVHDLV